MQLRLDRGYCLEKLIETLVEELERPREVTGRLADHIWSAYEIDRDAVGNFLESQLPDLEDYEHELILSPLFTPKLADQAVFAELLGGESVPKAEWRVLVQKLEVRPTRAQLLTSEGGPHAVVLREEVLERYIRLLRLDGAIPGTLWSLLEQESFKAEGPIFKAIARRAIWETDARRAILETYLAAVEDGDSYVSRDGLRLLDLVEGYKPRDVAYLLERIPQWQKALRKEIEEADQPKPFFDANVQENHGFDRDQRQPNDPRIAKKQEKLVFMERLMPVLTG